MVTQAACCKQLYVTVTTKSFPEKEHQSLFLLYSHKQKCSSGNGLFFPNAQNSFSLVYQC